MDIKSILYEALDLKYGLVVATNPEIFKRRFYQVRRAARKEGNMDFENIEIQTSPSNPTCEVWVVNKNAETEA